MTHYLPAGAVRLPAPPRPNRNNNAQGKEISMIKVDVANLTGPALDWAVAKVEGVNAVMFRARKEEQRRPLALFGSLALRIGGDNPEYSYSPSRCWHCGGPLIDKFRVRVVYSDDDLTPYAVTRECHPALQAGDTVLQAAMRAIVASELGNTVDVPAELVGG